MTQSELPDIPEALIPVVSFVEGRLPPLECEAALASSPALEKLLLEAPPISPYSSVNVTLFHYLIGLDYNDPSDILNAQDALRQFLAQHKIKVSPSREPSQLYDLLLSAQPKWLCADSSYLATLLKDAPDGSRTELRKWLQKRILERFKFVSDPPRWIQSPNWPIGPNGPLVFLGQISIPNYFHDDAAAYVFHDPTTGACETVIQVS
ncbi:MAG TPA: hypothetical protein VEJ63_15945 [Planctomycetota bacterium]|nr:hypothetical protein [Planctomycetota bacterium]